MRYVRPVRQKMALTWFPILAWKLSISVRGDLNTMKLVNLVVCPEVPSAYRLNGRDRRKVCQLLYSPEVNFTRSTTKYSTIKAIVDEVREGCKQNRWICSI